MVPIISGKLGRQTAKHKTTGEKVQLRHLRPSVLSGLICRKPFHATVWLREHQILIYSSSLAEGTPGMCPFLTSTLYRWQLEQLTINVWRMVETASSSLATFTPHDQLSQPGEIHLVNQELSCNRLPFACSCVVTEYGLFYSLYFGFQLPYIWHK